MGRMASGALPTDADAAAAVVATMGSSSSAGAPGLKRAGRGFAAVVRTGIGKPDGVVIVIIIAYRPSDTMASSSSGSLGMAAERTRQPFSVTSTSSSMRMPMPR